MTYLGFHFAFVLPPIVVLAMLQRRPMGGSPRGTALRALGLIVVAAFLYTILWDNYLAYRGAWSYSTDRVVGSIGFIPLEEYAFFVFQPVLTGQFYLLLRGRDILKAQDVPVPSLLRKTALMLTLCVACVGGVLLFAGSEHALYLGLILAWCGPVLVVLMWMGSEKVWPERRLILASIGIPTIYLWIADSVALELGIWQISEQYSLGIDLFGLPVEEAVFFLVTNWMVVQGVAMLLPDNPSYTQA